MAASATTDTDYISPLQSFSFDTFGNTINGQVVGAQKYRNGVNPATRKSLPDVPIATKDDLNTAVESARSAFTKWSQTPFQERKAAILQYADALEKAKGDFVAFLTKEQGKPIFQSAIEIDMSVQWLRDTIELGDVSQPTVIEDSAERKVYTRYTPLGVVGAIVPWNFPVFLMAAKLVPAVITGNTVIFKPSPFTPYCGLKLCELAQPFFPPGVIQCLSGDDDLGPWLTLHPGIDKISFTGSTATGKLVAASAATTLKRVTLELGGNDAAIICADADIAATVPQVTALAFLNSGQICCTLKRVYIHQSIYNEFRNAIAQAAKSLAVGNGMDNVFCGPIQNSVQYERVQGFFADIEKEKQTVVCGGQNTDETGFYINPTIIDNPPANSRIVVEEPFGPILPIMPWTDEAEVIAAANDTRMGLGASVWSRDIQEAERIALQLEAGNVWINKHFDPLPNAPFGGHKESGIGVEFGLAGLHGMCNVQTIYIKK